MRVTDVTVTKKGRFAVFLDGEFWCSMTPELFIHSHLAVGDEVPGEELAALQYESELQSAKSRALGLLSGQDYTAQQIFLKLTKKYDEEISAAAVARMQELGLIDDERYADRCARDLVNIKHFAPRRVKQELRRRGISDEDIEAALEQFLECDPRFEIARAVQRRFRKLEREDEKSVARVFSALVRLGYQYDDIRYVLANPDEFCEDDED